MPCKVSSSIKIGTLPLWAPAPAVFILGAQTIVHWLEYNLKKGIEYTGLEWIKPNLNVVHQVFLRNNVNKANLDWSTITQFRLEYNWAFQNTVQLMNTDCSTIGKTGLEWIGQNRNRVHHINIQPLLKGRHLDWWSANNTMLLLPSFITLVLINVVVHSYDRRRKGALLTKKE